MAALAYRISSMQPLIEHQIAGCDDVEFLIETDSGEVTSGEKRQRLLNRANGEYVVFVDDDDEISGDYVQAIVDRCHGVDVVTFRMDFVRNGQRSERWRLGLYGDNRRQGKMAANHLCAWRADLARRVSWLPLAYGDDQAWYGPLHASGLARREAHIPRTLYRYLWNRETTVNQQADRIRASRDYFGDGLKCYRDAAGEIYIADGQSTARAYLRGELVSIDLVKLEHFHTVRLQ